MATTTTVKLVTIVAERLLEDRIIKEILSLGSKGYTISDAGGKGSRGVRASEWEGPDVKIETVVSESVADKIVNHISDKYFEHYAVIVYMHDVQVVRGEKYV